MSPYRDGREYGEENFIAGAHGTIAEQQDEAFYDDRSDASDDMEKGRLKFPTEMYGRDRELEILCKLYDGLTTLATRRARRSYTNNNNSEMDKITTVEEDEEFKSIPDPFISSRVVFLSGYSGIGKSALVSEFIKQTQSKHTSSSILHASGKYTEQSTASAPFSAIIEVLEKLASDLSRRDEAEKLHTEVLSKIKESELIGPGTEGNSVLRATFTKTSSLLESCEAKSTDLPGSSVHHSMNAIKESTAELLSLICVCLEHPLVIFLDDLQWADEASIDILSLLLTSKKLSNLIFICAYRSNEVDDEHSFAKLMVDVKKARNVGECGEASTSGTVEAMDLFSLSPEAIKNFIADSVKKEDDEGEGVADLAEAVYTKTMGNIFFVKQALEELVRKNILFYDMMCFEWRWVVSKVELGNYMSDDVVETVKSKIKELSVDIQHMLVVMAYIPNSLDVSTLKALMNYGERSYEENAVSDILMEASDEGMVLLSNESKNWLFAHDRIREASLELAKEDTNQDQLLLHMSQVLLNVASDASRQWCFYVAVDIRNSLPSGMTDVLDLIQLNMKVSKIAEGTGSLVKENELLHQGLKCLENSGRTWKDYALTLELYDAVIESDYSTGSKDAANVSIDQVLKHARTLNDKLNAYLHQMIIKCEETSNYAQGATDGVKILNLYGFNIPTKISKSYLMKEEVKLKMALRNRSYYSCLTELQNIAEDPIFHLLMQTQRCATFTSYSSLIKVVTWKTIQCALKRGSMSKYLPLVLVSYGAWLAKQGEVKTSQEMGQVSLELTKKIPNDVDTCAWVQIYADAGINCQLRSFRGILDPFLQSHKALKLGGEHPDTCLGAMLAYFESYFAAGLELGPLVESKIVLVEEYCKNIERFGFLPTFQIYRQTAQNLRKRTEDPTAFIGDAFNEEEALNKMNENARKMALRDSSTFRLMLAFVFGNEEICKKLLKILQDYPLTDMQKPRLHNRLLYTGLAAFALCKRPGCESFLKLAQNCMQYFAKLTKYGSVNAKPVYFFMLAIKGPSFESFNNAIDACSEAGMTHLEAMAREHYASFLYKEQNQDDIANNHITVSYWLYQDWGAHAKSLQLSHKYDFLKNAIRRTTKSHMSGATMTSTIAGNPSVHRKGLVPAYSFNSTYKSATRKFVKKK